MIPLHQDEKRGKKRLLRELDFLKEKDVTNIRALVGSEGDLEKVNGVLPVHPNLQPRQSIFSEEAMQGLDYLLYGLRQRDLQCFTSSIIGSSVVVECNISTGMA